MLVVAFFKNFDPIGEDSRMNAIFETLHTVVGIFLSIFLFGCSSILDANCEAELPSVTNTIIKIKEDHNGDLYLASGTYASLI